MTHLWRLKVLLIDAALASSFLSFKQNMAIRYLYAIVIKAVNLVL